jgi:hypothetical protein
MTYRLEFSAVLRGTEEQHGCMAKLAVMRAVVQDT